jgi:thiol:disulfide interchange protein
MAQARALRRTLWLGSLGFAIACALGALWVARRARVADACALGEHASCAAPVAAHAAGAGAPSAAGGEASAPAGPAMLEFSSADCPACRRMEPILRDARRQCSAANLVRIDVESLDGAGGALAERWNVEKLPTLLLLDAAHREVARLVGVQPLADVRLAIERAFGVACRAG